MNPKKLLIADLDGTLVDADGLILEGLNTQLTAMRLDQYTLTRKEYLAASLYGGGIPDIAYSLLITKGMLLGHLPQVFQIARDLHIWWERFQREQEFPLLPDAQQFLQGHHNQGGKICVITNNTSAWARRILSLHEKDLPPISGLISARDDSGKRIHRSKPHPEMLRLAMDEFGASPRETVVLGDMLGKDGLAAFGAGIRMEGVLIRRNPLEEQRLSISSRAKEVLLPIKIREEVPSPSDPLESTFETEIKRGRVTVRPLGEIYVRDPEEAKRIIDRCLSKGKKGKKSYTSEKIEKELIGRKDVIVVEYTETGERRSRALQLISRHPTAPIGKIIMGDVSGIFPKKVSPKNLRKLSRNSRVYRKMLEATGFSEVIIEGERERRIEMLALEHLIGFRHIKGKEEIRVALSPFVGDQEFLNFSKKTGEYQRESSDTPGHIHTKVLYRWKNKKMKNLCKKDDL